VAGLTRTGMTCGWID